MCTRCIAHCHSISFGALGDRALPAKQLLQEEWFPAESKQWNADCNSGDRDWDRIVAEQNHERSATGKKIRFYQSMAQAAGPSAWLGENK